MSETASTYGPHASTKLRALFETSAIPYQGQDPQCAKILIFGLDENYSPRVAENSEFFQRVVEYHSSGVVFWQRHGIHHPFLLGCYPYKKNTGGVPYHRRFSLMGLTPAYAKCISFVELIHVPTTGRNEKSEFWRLFSLDHAQRLDDIVENEGQRLVLLSKSLMSTYMERPRKTHHVFRWLPERFQLGEMKRLGKTVIYGAPHFSSTTYKKETFRELGNNVRALRSRGVADTPFLELPIRWYGDWHPTPVR